MEGEIAHPLNTANSHRIDYEKDLNPAQQQAVMSTDGPLLVIAGLMTLGTFVAFMAYQARLMAPVRGGAGRRCFLTTARRNPPCGAPLLALKASSPRTEAPRCPVT